ncbi:hypothetical protein [Alteribacillus bidgolensis]|uniref:Uncharacterized protein n=1 Tax=Alteribacillus bidgolensis TaxID=930129 RepID=A0A1G8KXI3_9BACI|nr:hypothetical protein [Alteribacillus bidgolensis]SDI48102.1 hypothetical protein SAMN05216352_10857 [Alteribacillus bidgolensis]
MFENTTPHEAEQIEKQAKKDDQNAHKAEEAVTESLTHMNPQRQYSEDKSQSKR